METEARIIYLWLAINDGSYGLIINVKNACIKLVHNDHVDLTYIYIKTLENANVGRKKHNCNYLAKTGVTFITFYHSKVKHIVTINSVTSYKCLVIN